MTKEEIRTAILDKIKSEGRIIYHKRSPVGLEAVAMAAEGLVEIHQGENGLDYATKPGEANE